MLDLDWMLDGNCLDRDPELFHPVLGEGNGKRRRAKSVCGGCPVKEQCLEYAVTVPNRDFDGKPCGWVDGVWGGTVKFERDRMRRERGINLLTEDL
jgi:WhiB family redox-sensing transcriptional regulator